MVVLSWPIEHPTPTVPKRLPRITCRLCLLLVLATIRGAVFLVEQPSQTLMMEFPYFRWMASVFGRLVTWQVHRLLLALTGTLVQVTIVLMCICYMWLVPSGDWLSMLKQPNWVSWGAMGIHIWSQLWLLEQRLGLTYIFYIPLATGMCTYCCPLHMGVPSNPKTLLAIPSPWAIKMKKKLTKKVRKRAKRNSKKRAMVRKYKNRRGESKVCLAYECFGHMSSQVCWIVHMHDHVHVYHVYTYGIPKIQLRCGTANLRSSQVYPLGYGEALVKNHQNWSVSRIDLIIYLLEVVGTHFKSCLKVLVATPFISQVSANNVLAFKHKVYSLLAGAKPAEAVPLHLNGIQWEFFRVRWWNKHGNKFYYFKGGHDYTAWILCQ